MKVVKALLVAGLALGTLDTLAQAADFPLSYKAPPPIVHRWTGCYLGGHSGYGWRSGTSTHIAGPNAPDPFIGAGAVLPLFYDTKARSAINGGQVGCDWQVSDRFVVGLEVDYSAMHSEGAAAAGSPSGNVTWIGPAFFLVPPSTFAVSEQVSQSWLSTVRARAGGLVFDRLLLYVTGGAAIGAVSATGSVLGGNGGGVVIWNGATSEVRTGYVVGAGAEYAIDRSWSLKAEYLHYDLGTIQHPLQLAANTLTVTPLYASLGGTSTRIRGDIIRVGLNFRFSGFVSGY